MPDLPLDTILSPSLRISVPPAGVEPVVERAMAMLHVAWS